MCYIVLLSTTSNEDLARHNTDLLRFSRELPDEPAVASLAYPQRWYVGSKTGCSCTFRHLHSIELGFGPPVDWYPEEADAVDATLEFVAVMRALVEGGAAVDCVDVWSGEAGTPAVGEALHVDLDEVGDTGFRFFEGRRFDLIVPAGED